MLFPSLLLVLPLSSLLLLPTCPFPSLPLIQPGCTPAQPVPPPPPKAGCVSDEASTNEFACPDGDCSCVRHDGRMVW